MKRDSVASFEQSRNVVNVMDATDIMQIIERLVKKRGLEPAPFAHVRLTSWNLLPRVLADI